MSKINSILRKFKRIRSDSDAIDETGLLFTVQWVDHLISLLKKHKRDEEFISEVIHSAVLYYGNNLDDQQKMDVFAYLLAKVVDKK